MKRQLLLILFTALLISYCQTFDKKLVEKTVFNPILAGFYPDPSICRVENDYYLVNSTFAYFPGIPVFHSKDLINWRLIGHVLDRPEQFNTRGLGVSRGVFAPAIQYNQGTYYVTCTLVDCGGNFIVTAKNPAGPWSDPVFLPEINGIDPSLFFDDDGKSYILYNSDAPNNKPLYDGHRTIRMVEFDTETLKVTGNDQILVNGGVDISQKPVWIEGPHLLKKNEYYYLIPAEGGTAEDHSQVVFRSQSITGPYLPWEKNPILTQRHLSPDRPNPITSTGHADLFTAPDGSWWAIFLGCRPYEKNHYNTGRETFLAPVRWTQDGWPVINPDFEEVQYSYTINTVSNNETNPWKYSGNFSVFDDFEATELNLNWMLLRTPTEKWYNLSREKGKLALDLRPETCAGTGNPSMIGRRQQHIKSTAITAMEFSPESEKEKAGLLIFQNETHFYFLCKSLEKGEPVIQLFQSATGEAPYKLIASASLSTEQATQKVILKTVSNSDHYAFFYGTDPNQLQLLHDGLPVNFLSTKTAGGFVGVTYNMYATASGISSDNTVWFDWFEYIGNDDIYQQNVKGRK